MLYCRFLFLFQHFLFKKQHKQHPFLIMLSCFCVPSTQYAKEDKTCKKHGAI